MNHPNQIIAACLMPCLDPENTINQKKYSSSWPNGSLPLRRVEADPRILRDGQHHIQRVYWMAP
jgi:hypothetical protein